ncbi:MAG TPA: hypothetical protein VHQ90_20170 [Thermoanaerobaculia bacterium]|nr:hypothetical protein [Thermoanaerobaculia bacterium]
MSPRKVVGTALLGAALLARTPAAGATADPFYLDLLRDGTQAYARGDFATAAKELRLACFGLLDDPPQLASCLTRLALAQGAAGNANGFRESFRRLAEVEDRFGAYSKAELPADVRAAFEQRVLAGIPASTLEAMPAWRPLLNRKIEAQVAALPPRERRRHLEERLAKESGNVTWNLMLVELDLAEEKTEPALARAEKAAALAPADQRALCLRGLARSAGKRCPQAIADLEPCYLVSREPRYAAALLSCRVELGQWSKAEEQVRSLPPAFKGDRKLASLAREVAKHPPDKSSTAATTAAGKPAATTAAGKPGTATGAVFSTPPAAGGSAAQRPADKPGTPAPTDKTAAKQPDKLTAGNPADRTGASKPAERPVAGNPAAPAAGRAQPIPGVSEPGGRPLSAAEREAMERSRRLLSSSSLKDVKEALRLARGVADAHADEREAQYLAAEAAYRNMEWARAVAYFRRAGRPDDDHPELLFYMAVSFYEVGDKPEAAEALKRSLPNLQRTAYVDSYARRILGR